MNSDVRHFLANLPTNTRRTVKSLRALVLAAAGPTTESVLWRSLSYHRPELGGRVKGAVCLITPKTEYVELGFIHGTLLPDPSHLLTGHRRSKRVVRIADATKLRNNRSLHDLIRAAARIRPGGAVGAV
jgi:hypothetical protein